MTEEREGRTRLLMLHRVMPDHATAFGRPSCYRLRGTALTLEEFERVLEARPLRGLDEVMEALAADEPPPPGYVLTFDDGYREWIDQVAPRLEARRLRAAFFICPAFLASASRPHPVDAFYWLLDHARHPRFALRLPDDSWARGSLMSDEDKASLVVGDLKRFVVHGPREQVHEVLSALATALRVELPEELCQLLYPQEHELEALARTGHELGGHGLSHRHLTKVDEREVARELEDSLRWAQRLSGRRAVPFAYPDGNFDQRIAHRVESLGATCALTCQQGSVVQGSPRFQLPREFATPRHPLVQRASAR